MVREPTDHVHVFNGNINVKALLKRVAHPSAGAISTFLGVTRDCFEERKVASLEYEAYTPMAERVLKEICREIREKWHINKIAIEHRLGLCPVGEISVAIATSAAHRKEAIEATHYAIDALKARAPIWKKETYIDPNAAVQSFTSEWKVNAEWSGKGVAHKDGALSPPPSVSAAANYADG